MKSDKQTRKEFISLIGKDIVEYLEDNNWIAFETSTNPKNNKEDIHTINFQHKDGKGDTCVGCSIHYNTLSKNWWTENTIDDENILFTSYNEVVTHLIDIEDDIVGNGDNFPDLK